MKSDTKRFMSETGDGSMSLYFTIFYIYQDLAKVGLVKSLKIIHTTAMKLYRVKGNQLIYAQKLLKCKIYWELM
jgi:hypothetical protein